MVGMKIETHLDYQTILANQARPIHFALRFTAPAVAVSARQPAAFCIVLDRSGSMGGEPLATAALTAAAIAHRKPNDYSVLVFGGQVGVAKHQTEVVDVDRVVTSVLSLRGYGTTNLADALRESAIQLLQSTAQRRITVLLSDCRSTSEMSAEAVARDLDELVVDAQAAAAPHHDVDLLLLGVRVAVREAAARRQAHQAERAARELALWGTVTQGMKFD